VRKTRNCSFCVLFVLGLGILLACSSPDPTGHTTLRRGLGGEPSSLDPALAADTFSTAVIIDLYEGLTTESAAGEVLPGVAAAWTVDGSGTEYTFRLRDDARWSNGKKVIARDFVTSWRRVVDPKFGSPTADDLRLISHAASIMAGREPLTALGVSAPSDSILVVKLERAAPYFLQILAHPGTFPIYSTASATTHHPAEWISNGPYILASWQTSTGIDLKANPEYWDRKNVAIKKVRYQFTPDETVQYAEYRAGQLDLTDIVPANAVSTIKRENPGELIISPFLATAYYGINLANKELSNVALRQALAMAIDRKRLVEALGFGQTAAYGFVPPGTTDYTPQGWTWKSMSDSERVATAQRLYTKAGFSPAFPLRLKLLFSSNETIKRTAVISAAMWHEVLGVDVELTEEEFKVFLQSRHDKTRWDVARLAWNADFNDASNFLDVLRTHSPNNDMSYSNIAFDRDLDEAAKASNPASRRAHLEAAERRMLEDYSIIPLYYFVSERLIKPYVHGLLSNPLNHVPSKALTLDP
jgi:oligopeptide transport system substrate-binding protein